MRMEIKESDALIFAAGITIFIFFLTLIVLNGSIKSINSKIAAKKSEYEKALVLYNKIKSGNSNKKEFRYDILIFVQKLEGLKNLKNKIVSVSATGINNGVQLRIVGINLPQLIDIFETINKYGNIKIERFVVKRNFSSAKLVDLDIVLRKKI